MIVVRLLAVVIVGYLMTGCYVWGKHKSLERDFSALKSFVRATPSPTNCRPPGSPQARVCNYSLVVEPIEGDFYRGYVNRAVVEAGEAACHKIEKELQEYYADFECQKAAHYQYVWFEFKVEGDKPPADGKAHGFTNIANTGSLRLDKLVKRIESPIATPIREEFK